MQFLATIAAGLAMVAAAPGGSGVAPCETAMIGHGSADWREEGVAAGPVGVMPQPLRRMSQTKHGLVTKMPLLVEGREPETATVSVPAALRGRVFLYYGAPSTFTQDRGFAEVEFQPCGNKPRTVWPGGIRVRGTAPVRLNVFTEGRAEPYVLRLGRPKVFAPAS
ncbi:MAG TPA: hypothetical protein VFX85_01570 [Solirubrobacterales bacterium]|nr:hypothetical protein [Solirubrobacterales bacterium]